VAAAIDRTVVGAARFVIDRTVMPDAGEVAAMRAQAAFYATPELLAEPRPVLRVRGSGRAGSARRRGAARSPPARPRPTRIVFPSPYRPANPAFAAEHARLVENPLGCTPRRGRTRSARPRARSSCCTASAWAGRRSTRSR
jgi:hypothetical protein